MLLKSRTRLRWGVSALALGSALLTTAAIAQDATTASSSQKAAAKPIQVTSAPAAQASAAPAAPAAPAQTAAQQNGIQTITVTAEFRKENLQNTPIAITAVNAAMLDARSQTNIVQVTAQAPNVTLRPAGTAFGSSLVAFIRGVGQTDFNYSTEPGVGVYVDDIYYATITGNLLDLLDLDRVEVERGPQGTLNGRNSIGGAIRLFTKQANGSGGGFVEGTYGSFNRIDFRGGADFTVVPDQLFVRIAGVSRTRNGYVTNLDYGCATNSPNFGSPGGVPHLQTHAGCKIGTEGGQSYTGGRIQARWLPTDNFTGNFAFSMVNDNSEASADILIAAQDHSQSQIINGGIGSLVPIYYDNNGNHVFDAGDVPLDNRFARPGTYISFANFIDDGRQTPSNCLSPNPPGFPVDQFAGCELAKFKPYAPPAINHFNSWDASANFEWKLAENFSAQFISAYGYYTNAFTEDSSSSPLVGQLLLQRLVHRQFTEELRFTGNLFNNFVDYAFGGFYLEQHGAEDARVDLPYVGFDFIHGPDQTPSKNYAGYAHVTVHPTSQLDISAGLRESHDEKTYIFQRHNPDGTVPVIADCTAAPLPFFAAGNGPNCGVAGVNGLTSSFSSDRLDYRVAASYRWTPDFMTYAQLSTGYKGGGVNARPFFPSQVHAFQPETLTTYEAGFKTTLFDKVRFNGAAFWNLYKSIQLPQTVCTWALPDQQVPCAAQNNVGSAHVWGLEGEVEAHPFGNMEVDASYSYLHFEYTQVSPLVTVTKGMITPYTPTNKLSIGAQYKFDFDTMGSLTPRIDYSYQTSIFTDATNAPTNHIKGYGIGNARLTWNSEDESWSAAAAVTNLFDDYHYLTIFDNMRSSAGYETGQPDRPREFAVTLKRKF